MEDVVVADDGWRNGGDVVVVYDDDGDDCDGEERCEMVAVADWWWSEDHNKEGREVVLCVAQGLLFIAFDPIRIRRMDDLLGSNGVHGGLWTTGRVGCGDLMTGGGLLLMVVVEDVVCLQVWQNPMEVSVLQCGRSVEMVMALWR